MKAKPRKAGRRRGRPFTVNLEPDERGVVTLDCGRAQREIAKRYAKAAENRRRH